MMGGSRGANLALLSGLMLIASLDVSLAVMPVQATHPCAKQAADKALEILTARAGKDGRAEVRRDEIKTLNPVQATDGKGWLDVLEVPGSIAGGAERVQLRYAQGDDSCTVRKAGILGGE